MNKYYSIFFSVFLKTWKLNVNENPAIKMYFNYFFHYLTETFVGLTIINICITIKNNILLK